MTAPTTVTCDCGWTATCATPARAAYSHRRHSCTTHRTREARAARVAARQEQQGERRDCDHPRADHQHGTRQAYVLDRCRCRPCIDAATAYERHRRRQRAYGRADRIDATPVREHLQALSAAGIGWKRVAAAAGVATGTVYPILWGRYPDQPDHPEHRPPRRQVTRAVAHALLTVDVTNASSSRVDGTGTRRRLRALVAMGWTQTALAHRLGRRPGNLNPLLHEHRQTTAAFRQAVIDLYAELWDRDGGSVRARRIAERHGWPPPMAWDDDTIDLPDTGAQLTPSRAGREHRSRAVVEDADWLLEQGCSVDEAAARLGVSRGYLLKLRAAA